MNPKAILISILLPAALMTGCGSGPAGPAGSGGSGGGSSTDWTWAHPRPVGNTMHAVVFTSSQSGYAVGGRGTILKTTNGGASWSVSYVGDFTLVDVAFETQNRGVAVGPGGIARTTNGGASWETVFHTRELTDVAFTDGGLLVATPGEVYRSDDRGTTLTLAVDPEFEVGDIAARGDLCVVGTANGIYRSEDRGETWSDRIPVGIDFLVDVEIASSNVVYVCEGEVDEGVYRSEDGGETWTPVALPNTRFMRSLSFDTRLRGFALGEAGFTTATGAPASGGGDAILHRTEDAGVSWTPVSVPDGYRPLQVHAASASSVVLLGRAQDMYWSDNAGASWSPLLSSVSQRGLSNVSMPDSRTIVAVDNGGCMRSTDAGQSWQHLAIGDSYSLNGIAFFDAKIGAAVGHPGQVWFTSDGGESWDMRGSTATTTLYRAHWFSATELIVVGAGNNDIIYSSNSGTSWALRPSPNTGNLVAMDFDGENGVVSGHNRNISLTSNRGQSWSVVGTPSSVVVFSECARRGNTIIAATVRQIYRSADNGGTWQLIDIPTSQSISALACRSETEVFLTAGDELFHSTDAGATWEAVSGFRGGSAQDMHFTPGGQGTLVGHGAIVMRLGG